MTRAEYMRHYFKSHHWVRILNWVKYRCNNPKATNYINYGGKGIKCYLTLAQIKELWFRDGADKMKKPSIDRKDSKGNYEFSNCQFIELSKNIAERNIRVDSIPVFQFTLSGNFIRVWGSLRDIEKTLGYSHSHISKVCQHKRKQAYQFIWRFA